MSITGQAFLRLNAGGNHVQYSYSKYQSNRRKHYKTSEAGGTVRKRHPSGLCFSTPQAIYKWQQGIALPTVDNLVVLSTLFGVSIDEILVLDCDGEVRASA